MRVSYTLLRKFLPTKFTPDKLADLVSAHSFELEVKREHPQEYDNIVCAKVLEISKHPNADRLRLVKLDAGERGVIEPVVCGAWNFKPGDMVALALPGARIAQNIHTETHESFILNQAKIRGVESQGMICAAFELGLSRKPEEGIMLLDKSLAPGSAFAESLKTDVHLVANLPANRPDLHSHLGLAKEIGAILGKTIKDPSNNFKAPKLSAFNLTIKDKRGCPKYLAIKFDGIKVAPSPNSIVSVLRELGVRPVNNVVDITNLISAEIGQPVHAFDAQKITGGLTVRRAAPREKFLALNHKEYVLDTGMLVIADQKQILALAGIMGGKSSEVGTTTTEIILEIANFEAFGIRKTAQALGLRTEASALFEKAPHPNLVEMAAVRAVELLSKYAGAKLAGAVQTNNFKPRISKIKFSVAGINRLLGSSFTRKEITAQLKRFDIKTNTDTATPPWWRTDLINEPDLAEEVLKLSGYSKIRPIPFALPPIRNAKNTSLTDSIYTTKEFWARLGYLEAQNYNFLSAVDIEKFGASAEVHMEVLNPLSQDQKYLKRHLLIPLLKNVALNQKQRLEFSLFEVGKQYLGFEHEPLLLTSVRYNPQEAAEKLLMKAKGDIVAYFKHLGLPQPVFENKNNLWQEIRHKNIGLGLVGLVQDDIVQKFGIDSQVIFIELELEKLWPLKRDPVYQELPRHPFISRDVSIIVSSEVSWQKIEDLIRPVSDLIVEVGLFEAGFLTHDKSSQRFHEDLAKKGKKNLGIRLKFQHPKYTLKDDEITGILEQIMLKLRQDLKAEIR